VAKKVKSTAKKKAPASKAASGNNKTAPKAKKAGKRVAAKKASPKKKVAKKTMPGKSVSARSSSKPAQSSKSPKEERLTPEEIEGFRRLLLEKWNELLMDVNHIEGEALRKSRLDAAGDLSSMPIHMADLGTDNFEQEFSLGLMDSERKILAEIVAALRRIKDGTYGICEGTGKTISKARLQASPWARYCIEYARMVEGGMVAEGEKVYSESEGSDQTDLEDEFNEDEAADKEIDDGGEDIDLLGEAELDEIEDDELEL